MTITKLIAVPLIVLLAARTCARRSPSFPRSLALANAFG